ncbi:hypothetical protein J2S43_000890 [Catenuloplanes nepalensis]|uniref:Subtilisin inhibitor domain-containing protein n=1 Tax=Catenuloplanes nepalensis TaxID=587533 RepID=A0ABT9MM47_9ACTN|nr:SSI family serine proteinase inhibitor [Catenuloplanes nepalensis]MDP9792378.1 hypothetical protein [Catenuloplanes nepalensis]
MIRHLAVAALATAATAALLPGAAQAAPAGLAQPGARPGAAVTAARPAPAAAPFARLTLTLTGDRAAGRAAALTLTCGPVGGTHPAAPEVCAALKKTGGNVFGLPPRDGFLCTAEYRPVVAAATGYWGKRRIADRKTFGNACQLGIEAGTIFTPARS